MVLKDKLKSNKFFMKIYNKFLPLYCMLFTKSAVKMLYKQTFQKKLNLNNPHDFNEKIQWLKVYKYKKDKLVIQCADKYRVREYVKEKGCADILNELYGVYHSYKEFVRNFDISSMPEQFVLKLNRGAGYNLIIDDKKKIDKKELYNKVKKWFKAECGERYCELHYRKAKPCVICEKYLCDGEHFVPIDYKVHCFNGEPEVTMVCTERNTELKFMFVNNNYNYLDYNTDVHRGKTLSPKPTNFEKMISIARKLSKPFLFVRLDFYEVNEKIYIGEMTFTPQGGYIDFINEKGLQELGDKLVLPSE